MERFGRLGKEKEIRLDQMRIWAEKLGVGAGGAKCEFLNKKVGSQGRKGDRPRLSGFFLVVCPALML